MSARERLPVGQRFVLLCGVERTCRDTALGARERLPVDTIDAG